VPKTKEKKTKFGHHKTIHPLSPLVPTRGFLFFFGEILQLFNLLPKHARHIKEKFKKNVAQITTVI
jgi:hypothetical protein